MSDFLPEDKLRKLYVDAMRENTDLFIERNALRAELEQARALLARWLDAWDRHGMTDPGPTRAFLAPRRGGFEIVYGDEGPR